MVPFIQALGFRPGLDPGEGVELFDQLLGPQGEARRVQMWKALDLMNGPFNAHGVAWG